MRINIIVSVPSISREFDLSVPDTLPLDQLTALIAKGVEDMSNNSFRSSGTEFLCEGSYDLPLDLRKTLRDYQIKNGDRVFMF